MIELATKDYCQKCNHFKEEVTTFQTCEGKYYTIDCKRRMVCDDIYKGIKAFYQEEKKNENKHETGSD